MMERTAELSTDGIYRYRLDRVWNRNRPKVAWVCLNPSKADATTDDATVRKIFGFSARLGYGGFALFNVLALRATDPRELHAHLSPWGFQNQPWRIAELCRAVSTDPAIIAWGNMEREFRHLALEVVRELRIARCFGYTKSGQPLHPLRLGYNRQLQMTDPSHWL